MQINIINPFVGKVIQLDPLEIMAFDNFPPLLPRVKIFSFGKVSRTFSTLFISMNLLSSLR
ncbi:hypothetical protein DNJ73_06985 [Prochlorococcus marinus XMU1408]|uniref:Uncharacterized protein n=1 Tax=Prochlorococcus marinus XMU1408 TaxID=2213228 RepID=A0A318QXB8_PROMR|nr:hypothetical protein [Prochlorococcus marinus str. XMU1408]PYE01165.1 hypothetical protein DNJ73_06985 [Prochlorococcus marinus XMU1408]